MKTYLTIEEVSEIAAFISFMDDICDNPLKRDPIARAHEIIETALGEDAHIVYEVEE